MLFFKICRVFVFFKRKRKVAAETPTVLCLCIMTVDIFELKICSKKRNVEISTDSHESFRFLSGCGSVDHRCTILNYVAMMVEEMSGVAEGKQVSVSRHLGASQTVFNHFCCFDLLYYFYINHKYCILTLPH